jgi:hypothetical protein
MYGHQYDQHRAAKLQDATEEMIRMRRPRSTGPHPDPNPARCIDGRLLKHHPFPNDPDHEQDAGECPHYKTGDCDCECGVRWEPE